MTTPATPGFLPGGGKPAIRDAVTAVLLCEGALLMVQRQPWLPSFAGYTAFPGGKVEAADATGSTRLQCAGVAPHILVGLVREVREELGIDLDALAAEGAVTGVHLLGEATTPPIVAVRFCTRFIRIDLKYCPALTVETGELAGAGWATPAEWMTRYDSGRLLLAPPTLDTVQALATTPDRVEIRGLDDDGPADECPVIAPLHGLRVIPVRSNTLPPASHTNAFLIGDSHQVLVDPSPANEAELARLCKLLDRVGCDEILLTHHHPDHRQFANVIAGRYDVPLAMSEDTRVRIHRRDPQWLGDLLIRTYQDGDVLTRWHGEPVRLLAVPGHDEGQLALMPDSRAWCIVGDLIQGIGTVVIAKPEGHMGRYFATLQKVIDLDPAVIVPSHGMALGSTYRLRETLKHRREREAKVLELHLAGTRPSDMLPLIYQGLDPRLLPLAAMNIESHLDKLREEGRLDAA